MQLGDETGDIVRALMYEIFILNMKYTNMMLECNSLRCLWSRMILHLFSFKKIY
jgi:hypothetical protein